METRKKARNTLVGNFTFLMMFSDVYLCYLFKVSLLFLKKKLFIRNMESSHRHSWALPSVTGYSAIGKEGCCAFNSPYHFFFSQWIEMCPNSSTTVNWKDNSHVTLLVLWGKHTYTNLCVWLKMWKKKKKKTNLWEIFLKLKTYLKTLLCICFV